MEWTCHKELIFELLHCTLQVRRRELSAVLLLEFRDLLLVRNVLLIHRLSHEGNEEERTAMWKCRRIVGRGSVDRNAVGRRDLLVPRNCKHSTGRVAVSLDVYAEVPKSRFDESFPCPPFLRGCGVRVHLKEVAVLSKELVRLNEFPPQARFSRMCGLAGALRGLRGHSRHAELSSLRLLADLLSSLEFALHKPQRALRDVECRVHGWVRRRDDGHELFVVSHSCAPHLQVEHGVVLDLLEPDGQGPRPLGYDAEELDD